MKYESYSFILPPRAETKIPVDMLRFYEKRNFIAQVKKNGTNSVIFLPPIGQGDIFAKTRHGEDHKAWKFSDQSREYFEKLRTKKWNVYNAELMHSKVSGIRDTHYVHDVLVADGVYLIGTTYADRYEFLTRRFRGKQQTLSHILIDNHTWLAKNHTTSFRALFDRLDPSDEGLVLKEPTGVFSARDNSSWSVKCRKLHKNFGF